MFDTATTELISSAPSLTGLDLSRLPQDLTRAFAEIVSTRMRIRRLERDDDVRDFELVAQSISRRMRKIAAAQEALATIVTDDGSRRAAAFVAASAHQAALRAEKLLGRNQYSTLAPNHISADVAAAILFLCADSAADAAELAREINAAPGAPSAHHRLLNSVRGLITGNLQFLARASAPSAQDVEGCDLASHASNALYLHLDAGVRALARYLLGDAGPSPEEYFSTVLGLASYRVPNIVPNVDAYNVYGGPAHLAKLLATVTSAVKKASLAHLDAPVGVSEDSWRNTVRRIAKERPYLWPNHRAAIEQGYLHPGVSSVVSFPTGAGKSTLSELKAAVALIQQKKVLYLAPTLALVDQVSRTFSRTFPSAEIAIERRGEQFFEASDNAPSISVMTPERCLALMGFAPEIFEGIGLVIFDECHLLHRAGGSRSLDAMLCLLGIQRKAPNADLLLISAMISNAGQLAGWLTHLLGRRCLALDLPWKPTRQMRGCLVYQSRDLDALDVYLESSYRNRTTNLVPVGVLKQLRARPFALFSLNHSWHPDDPAQYSLLPLIDGDVSLTANRKAWKLGANANSVATEIAFSAAALGTADRPFKTLVFALTVPFADSIFKRMSHVVHSNQELVQLTTEEASLFTHVVEELGSETVSYLVRDRYGNLLSSALPHHALLLPSERRLHESLYRRPNGINVLVATSTLAQGMNLPSQLVVIAGDTRFDPDKTQLEQLKAHELLNAAGRAGRAGECGQGVVLVIPSRPIGINTESGEISEEWQGLQSIFSQSDQCLEIEDPLDAVLDQIHTAEELGSDRDALQLQLLRRISIILRTDNLEAGARHILSTTLGAHQRRHVNDQDWADSRIESLMSALQSTGADGGMGWADRLGALMGADGTIVQAMADRLELGFPTSDSVLEWVDWLEAWISGSPSLFAKLLRPGTLEDLFGSEYERLPSDEDRGVYAYTRVLAMLRLWVSGATILDIDRSLDGEPNETREESRCKAGRKFATKLVRDLSYLFSWPYQVLRVTGVEAAPLEERAPLTSVLGTCVREGVDSRAKLALREVAGEKYSRPGLHRRWSEIEGLVGRVSEEPWEQLLGRVAFAESMV